MSAAMMFYDVCAMLSAAMSAAMLFDASDDAG
jgi:hypothetical protein